MPTSSYLSGQRFGRLTVLSLISKASPAGRQSKYRDAMWLCRCECGIEKAIARANLKNGSTQSCGCFRNTQGGYTRKHPLWKRWNEMIARCTTSNNKDFVNYGGRGIKVCERWRSFPLFIEDMEASYSLGATLERKDNDGDYDPGNVIWASRMEQNWNKQKTVFIETPWGRMSRGEAAKRAGTPISIFISRVRCGWSTDRLFDPANRAKLTRWSRRS